MPARTALFRTAALAGLMLLAACNRGGENNLAAIDNELIANGADPALTSALEDQIMVDPNLVQQSNPNTARPPETPAQSQYPADARPGAGASGGRVRQAAATSGGRAAPPSTASCGAAFDHSPRWASRMPAEFPAYPGGRVTEAAGNDNGDCRMRVVTFTTSDPYNRVLEHYRSVASRGGYSAEHQVRGNDQVLGGTKGDSAFYLIVTPARGGSQVALIVNNGR